MSILKDGATYRFENRAAENEVDGKGRSLNVYGNSPSILANVCLWTSDDDDICQQWVYEASATEDRGYLRCKGASNLQQHRLSGGRGDLRWICTDQVHV